MSLNGGLAKYLRLGAAMVEQVQVEGTPSMGRLLTFQSESMLLL